MHLVHPDNLFLVAGLSLMSLTLLWASTRLKTISGSQERLALFKRVGVINSVILLITISLFVIIR